MIYHNQGKAGFPFLKFVFKYLLYDCMRLTNKHQTSVVLVDIIMPESCMFTITLTYNVVHVRYGRYRFKPAK